MSENFWTCILQKCQKMTCSKYKILFWKMSENNTQEVQKNSENVRKFFGTQIASLISNGNFPWHAHFDELFRILRFQIFLWHFDKLTSCEFSDIVVLLSIFWHFHNHETKNLEYLSSDIFNPTFWHFCTLVNFLTFS